MQPGDPVTAPRWRGGKVTQNNEAVFVGPAPDRRERDRSNGEILVFPQLRVRYVDGEEANWDEAFVKPRQSGGLHEFVGPLVDWRRQGDIDYVRRIRNRGARRR